MGELKPPNWPRLPSGDITPLGLLAFSTYLFHLSINKDLENWLRIVLVCVAVISVLLCLIAFGGKLPCKKRVTTQLANRFSICLRDLGFLAGLVLSFLCIEFVPPSEWDFVKCHWQQLGAIRFFIILSLALPTVVQGTIRRLTNTHSDRDKQTKVLLFLFGFLNALIALALFLEFET